jgi:CO/xanthine dehydrogenase Mo-binding subunit
VHLTQVRIPRDSCAIAVERFFVGCDFGQAVNPMLVEGPVVGGSAQGTGATLRELSPHTDSCDLMGLACLRRAESGG